MDTTRGKEKTTEYFNRTLIEMGVNTGIVLVLVLRYSYLAQPEDLGPSNKDKAGKFRKHPEQ
jgi:hypothetical protein